MSSSKKKAVSMTSMILMRVPLDQAHFDEEAMAARRGEALATRVKRRWGGRGWRRQRSKSQGGEAARRAVGCC